MTSKEKVKDIKERVVDVVLYVFVGLVGFTLFLLLLDAIFGTMKLDNGVLLTLLGFASGILTFLKTFIDNGKSDKEATPTDKKDI